MVARSFIPIGFAILAVSDTRSLTEDRSGALLAERLQTAGHQLVARVVVRDEIPAITATLRDWIKVPAIWAVLVTGGTGLTPRDVTPEALQSLGGRDIPGFGEMFRLISHAKIGMAALQSRALAVQVENTLIFGLPGSPGACADAWDDILKNQFDARTRPCNFVHGHGGAAE